MLAVDLPASVSIKNSGKIRINNLEFGFTLVGSVDHAMALFKIGAWSSTYTKEQRGVYLDTCRNRIRDKFPSYIAERASLINGFVFDQLNPIDQSLLKVYPIHYVVTRRWRGLASWSGLYSPSNSVKSGVFSKLGDIGISVEIDLGSRDSVVTGVELTFEETATFNSKYGNEYRGYQGEFSHPLIQIGLGQHRPLDVASSNELPGAELVDCHKQGLKCLLSFPRIARTAQIFIATGHIDKLLGVKILVE